METSNDCFIAALQKELKTQGRGAKKDLASSVGVSPNHLSDILALRKNAGQNLKERIADNLGVSFEEMLVLGRRIIEERADAGGDHPVEKDNSSGSEEVFTHLSDQSADFLAMARTILESNTPFREALISNITAYHQAIDLTAKEKKALELIQALQREINILRRDIDDLKRSAIDAGDAAHFSAA